jgi:hypothetical protein
MIELVGSSSLKIKKDATAATRAFKTKMILCKTKMWRSRRFKDALPELAKWRAGGAVFDVSVEKEKLGSPLCGKSWGRRDRKAGGDVGTSPLCRKSWGRRVHVFLDGGT